MTTYEALSLVAQFSLSLIASLTLIVTIVVYLQKKEVTAP
ncbi:putative holin-like toxin [Virgibacillus doumboii]|nr:putative holin-like toxin [Virgibacillus doumboii]